MAYFFFSVVRSWVDEDRPFEERSAPLFVAPHMYAIVVKIRSGDDKVMALQDVFFPLAMVTHPPCVYSHEIQNSLKRSHIYGYCIRIPGGRTLFAYYPFLDYRDILGSKPITHFS